MASSEKSLRLMVERWLIPEPAGRVRVSRFRNSRVRRECYVCVEAFNATGRVAMFFFRHQDGAWRIFPPSPERPTMRVA
ncbi:hypothetical protein QZM30_34960 [Burkholderia orbicola]|nr:hypothetical protein [Burkholderia orbicola]MCA8057419.1 hypothetical protein [Burkholderia cepacia]MDN7535274.1 hypothetical protein [Burkholderia orbicola]